MALTWARLYNYTSLLTRLAHHYHVKQLMDITLNLCFLLFVFSGAFYKSKPLEAFLRAYCGDISMIDTTCDTSVKTAC